MLLSSPQVDLPEVESFHIVEVQIHIFLFTKARKKAHAQYEKIRSMLPKLCPGCPPKELNRVQYLILDSLKTAVYVPSDKTLFIHSLTHSLTH